MAVLGRSNEVTGTAGETSSERDKQTRMPVYVEIGDRDARMSRYVAAIGTRNIVPGGLACQIRLSTSYSSTAGVLPTLTHKAAYPNGS